MICVSIAEPSFERCLEALEDIELAEIRLDKVGFSLPQIEQIFSLPRRLVATYRREPADIGDEARREALLTAVSAGAAYVDIELEAPAAYRDTLVEAAGKRSPGCRVIVSHHDFRRTPPREELEEILEYCFRVGADIAKIACRVHSPADCARILSLYDRADREEIIAIGMGSGGRITRIAAPLLGAPFTYASLSAGKETAGGQLDRASLKKILAILQDGDV